MPCLGQTVWSEWRSQRVPKGITSYPQKAAADCFKEAKMIELPSGCVKQRDKKTYGVRVTPPAGMLTPDDLETVARVARKYAVPVLKITSGQRLTLLGLKEDEVGPVCDELPFKVAGHYVQACPGNQWCQFGVQDALEMAAEVEKRFSCATVPAKLKLGVSGCFICCAESYVRDLGLVGTRKGWTVLVGGSSGCSARVADVLAEEQSQSQALDLIARFLDYYRENALTMQRVPHFLEERGIDAVRRALV